MPQSESTAKLAEALAKAQGEFETITKNKIGQEGNQKFPYSTLSQVLEAVRPSLNKWGIFLSQPIVVDLAGTQRVTTRVQLSGEWISTDGIALSPGLTGSKKLGLEITYSKRYDLISFLGVCAEDDDKDAPDLKSNVTSYIGRGTPGHSNLARTAAGAESTWAKPINTPAQVAQHTKATDFAFGENARGINPEITDEDVPKFDGSVVAESKLPAEAAAVADHLLHFVPLTESRNTQIQEKLKELVKAKTVDRRKLSLFLDNRHGGKKSFDVSAAQWEETVSLLDKAIETGPDAVKALLKVEKVEPN